jgi:hypothetical protein
MSFILTRLRLARIATILFSLCCTPTVFAQIEQLAHFQMPGEEMNQEPYKVVSAAHEGLLICRNLPSTENDQLEITQLDTTLNIGWRGMIPIEKNLRLLDTKVSNGILFLLFKSRAFNVGNFLILSVKISNGNYGRYIVKNMIPFTPTKFTLTKEAALISGYFNYRPLIVYFNFFDSQSKVLPGFFNEPGELTQVRPNEDGSIDVIVSGKNFEKKKCLWIRNYSNAGNLIKTVILTPEDKKSLLVGNTLTSPSDDQEIVIGVYGRNSEYSRGIFVAKIDPVGEYNIRYYNYSELEHFFNYMKASRQVRIKKRIERKRIKGRKLKFNYRFLVHDLIPYKDQFIMVGEAFFPHYTYNSTRTMSRYVASTRQMYNPLLMRDNMVFDGYQYTHAVVIGFDHEGNVLWDNSFQINEVKSMQLEKFVKIQPGKDQIAVHYLFENVLRTKIIKDSEVFEGKNKENLPVKSRRSRYPQDDGIKSSLENWYDNYFYTYGTEMTKTIGVSSKGVKKDNFQKVFFINKITYK